MIRGFLVLLVMLTVPGWGAVYFDGFEDGDYTTAAGDTGLTWQVVRGGASVTSGQLAVNRDTSLLVTDQTVDLAEYTISYYAVSTWSEKGIFVFLYKDTANYYWQGLGGNAGVYRVMDGVQEKIYTDNGSLIRLPHQSGAANTFKIHINNTGSAIEFDFDRGGDGLDYDVSVTDTSSAAAARFVDCALGTGDQTAPNSGSWFKVDDVAVHAGFKDDRRPALTLYVDAATGDDSRTIAEAQNEATPWKTIQTAADSAMAGDVVRIKPGIYREEVIPANKGSEAQPITYMADDPDDPPVMDGSVFINESAWTETTVTDFAGNAHTVYKTSISWEPKACFQNEVQMFYSQHPNQLEASDPYDLDSFMVVPADYNTGLMKNVLYDPAFFTQADAAYWVGATVMLYDGYNNAVGERQVTTYVPAQNAVMTEPFGTFVGPNNGRTDKYAIQKHLSVLDKPGEFYVEVSDTPHTIYVMPFAGQDVRQITASKHNNAFNLSGGYKPGIVIDGFDMRFYVEAAVEARNWCNGLVIKNSEIHHNKASGITVRAVDGVTVQNCLIHSNYADAASFSDGSNYRVIDCEITANADNGVWCGSGSSKYFTTDGFTMRGCFVHRQGGRRRHPDNYQMHQVKNVYLDNNVFIQEGHQNMWCQYTDNFNLRNNIFLGGTLGLNSTMHNYVYHNVFHSSTLRYDAHLDNHPDHGDYYKPQQVVIRNNMIINSSIAWPNPDLVNRFDAYTVDHNYYNLENSYTRSMWDWQGYRLGLYQGGSMLAASPDLSGTATATFSATETWSAWGRFIFAYADANNFYSFGMGGDAGVFRMQGGVEEKIADDTGSLIRIPHSSGTWADYEVEVTVSGNSVAVNIARDNEPGVWDAQITDENPVMAALLSTFKMGVMTSDTTPNSPRTSIDNVVITDGTATWYDAFEDGNYSKAEGDTGMAWTLVAGDAVCSSVSGAGVGFGQGSIVHTVYDSLASVITQVPDSLFGTFDYTPLVPGILHDAGIDVGMDGDAEGELRWMGTAPDIGPFEYVEGVFIRDRQPADRHLPVLLSLPNPVAGPVVLNVSGAPDRLYLYTVTGRPAAELAGADGRYLLDPDRLRPGLYLLRSGDGELVRRVVITD